MIVENKFSEFLRQGYHNPYNLNKIHHISFWILYFGFNVLRWTSINNDLDCSIKTNIIEFPLHIGIAYFNMYYLMPKFVYTQKYARYGLFILLSLLMVVLIKYNVIYYLVIYDIWPNIVTEKLTGLSFNYAITTMIGEFYVISFVTAIKITFDWMRENNKLHQLEKRQLTTELKFLRSQVSPHFFFNTLNNIYSLTLEKSDKAPEVVLKLSDMMRYLLYATKKRKQNLSMEIECIENYIALERIRFNDSLKINFNINGNVDKHYIAPMLLVPLVENCFKHGASKNIGEVVIDIDLRIENDFMYFTLINTIPTDEEELVGANKIGGIGLLNVKKRLDLGYNKDDYDLSIFEKDNRFNVILKLKV